MTGNIFDIQRMCTHDGPGIRTTVFFKGCGMKCAWCHNPESISPRKQIMFYAAKCTGCGGCEAACGTGAIRGIRERRAEENCTGCGNCARVCPAEALQIKGQEIGLDDLVRTALRDKPFYRNKGGVTVSGGEPLLQADFLAAFLEILRQNGVHTAVDTAGNVPWAAFEEVLPHTELFLYDVKSADDEKHRQMTGVSNRLILQNLENLCARGKEIWIRIPVVPMFNDTPEEIRAICLSIPKCVQKIELLPFHKMAGGKYEALGLVNRYQDAAVTPEARMDEVRAAVEYMNRPVQ